jgi:hypothetical protein
VLYATTPQFLERLGLPSLAALPSLAPLLGADGDEAGALADQVAEDGSSNDRSVRRDVTVLGDEDDDPVDEVDDGDDDAAGAAAEVVARGADADPDDHPSVAEVDPGAG